MYVRIVPGRERDRPAEVRVLRHGERRFERVRHRTEIAREHSRQLVYVLARDIARVAAQPLRDRVGGDPLVEPDSQQVDHQDCAAAEHGLVGALTDGLPHGLDERFREALIRCARLSLDDRGVCVALLRHWAHSGDVEVLRMPIGTHEGRRQRAARRGTSGPWRSTPRASSGAA